MTLATILLSAVMGSAMGWVAGFACCSLRHHWQRASREGAPVDLSSYSVDAHPLRSFRRWEGH